MATQVPRAQLTVCGCAILPDLPILVGYEDCLKGPMNSSHGGKENCDMHFQLLIGSTLYGRENKIY